MKISRWYFDHMINYDRLNINYYFRFNMDMSLCKKNYHIQQVISTWNDLTMIFYYLLQSLLPRYYPRQPQPIAAVLYSHCATTLPSLAASANCRTTIILAASPPAPSWLPQFLSIVALLSSRIPWSSLSPHFTNRHANFRHRPWSRIIRLRDKKMQGMWWERLNKQQPK